MVIPRLTTLPASVQQELKFQSRQTQQVTLVESNSTVDTKWIPFSGFDVEPPTTGVCDSTFDVGEDGLVQVRSVRSQIPSIKRRHFRFCSARRGSATDSWKQTTELNRMRCPHLNSSNTHRNCLPKRSSRTIRFRVKSLADITPYHWIDLVTGTFRCPSASSSRVFVNGFLAMLCLILIAGCGGESTQEKMLRVAKERAAIRKQREAQEAKEAQLAAKAEPKTVPAEASPKPAAEEAETPAKTAAKPDPKKPAQTVAKRDKSGTKPPPKSNQVTANVRPGRSNVDPAPKPSTGSPIPAVEAETTLPRRDELMIFGKLGEKVAFVGESQSIGVYDVKSKRLERQVFNAELTPFSMAMGENGKQLVVGGMDGGLKIFSLESVDGLDKFQQNRKRRLDAEPPRKAHDNPITAVAISEQAGIAATGDSTGAIKLWSSDSEPPLKLTGDAGGYSHLLSYQDDQILFGAAANKIVYWQVGENRLASNDFAEAEFDEPLTSMVIGPDAKGLAVGDASGRVTLWTPEGDDLKKVSFPAHGDAIDGLGFADNGNTLVTVARNGDIAQWKLPIEPQQSFDVVEAPEFVVSSPDGKIAGLSSRGKNLDVYALENGSAVRRHTISNGRLTTAEFSADAEYVALANDNGRVVFQDSNRRTIAYSQLSDQGITRLVRSPGQSNQFAYATASGEVGVTTFPEKGSGPLATIGNVAAMNPAGKKILVARESELKVLETQSGMLANSTRVAEGRITALAIDENLALIGTSSGTILAWPYSLSNTAPKVLAKGIHESEIVAIGSTNIGQVWSCDSSGKTQVTDLERNRRFERGSVSFAISQVNALRGGRVFLLDDQKRLRLGKTIEGPFTVVGERTWNGVHGQADRVVAVDSQARYAEILSSDAGTQAILRTPSDRAIASVDIVQENLCVAFDDESVVGITLPAGMAAQRSVGNGTADRALISSNGQTILSQNDQGTLFLSRSSGTTRPLNQLVDVRPLALSPNGNLLAVAKGGRAVCYQINRDSPQLIAQFGDEIANPSAAQFSADGKGIVFALQSGLIISAPVAESDRTREIATLKKPVTALSLDEANSRISCLHVDGTLVVLASERGEVQFESVEQKFVSCVTSGGRTFAATSQGEIYQLEPDADEVESIVDQFDETLIGLTTAHGGQLVAAMTSNGSLVSVDTNSGVSVTVPAIEGLGKPLAMKIVGGHVVVVTANSELKSRAMPRLSSIAPESSGIRKVAVSANGAWAVGLRSNGSMVRWQLSGGAYSAPMRCSISGEATDVIAFGSESEFGVLSESSVTAFNAAEDSASDGLSIEGSDARLVSASSTGVVIVATAKGPQGLDLRRGTIERLLPDWGKLAKDTHLIAASLEGRPTWVAYRGDGNFVRSSRLSASQRATGFSLQTAPRSAAVAAGLLVAATSSSVNVHREDGSQVASMDVADSEIVCVGVHPATSNTAVGDTSGRLTILQSDSNDRKQLRLPTQNKVRSLAWLRDGSRIAATDGERIVTVNRNTGKIESQLISGVKIKDLVCWNEDGLWLFDDASRLQKLHLPITRWSKDLATPATSIAWSENGDNLIALTSSGNLLKFDSRGNEQARVVVGKNDLRSLRSIPKSERFVFLADNDICLLDERGQIAKLPISSAIGLRSVCSDGNGEMLFVCNDLGQIVSWTLGDPSAVAGIVPCDVRCDALATVDAKRMLAYSQRESRVAVLSDSLRTDEVARFGRQVVSTQVASGGAFVAATDGSSKVQLLALTGGEPRELTCEEVQLEELSIDRDGTHVAGIGKATLGEGSSLLVWDAVDLKQLARSDFKSRARRLCYSHDGSLIAVTFADGHCEIFDSTSAKMLESIAPIEGLQTVAFTQDSKRLLLARQDGSISVQSLMALGQSQASGSAIVSASFHGGGKYLLWREHERCDDFVEPRGIQRASSGIRGT